ncbi:Multidrug resistance protein NorM [Aquisphaera giovannonii]|uniref:Multidrug-efflux transporter n=1 Tax=Aquisphaera giovannonii TaxID=406548 RepID=A0A5B9W3W7_9BACT|nr:MATE family efflux transporter [Aquisphaera giovannonii]QEH35278.1 Multidrug resistance protein NorM [Aquisphaera giovannonii]
MQGWIHWKRGIRGELGPMLALAGPVVLAELGWMSMGIVDTMFVGRLGAEAIGAVSLGNALFFAASIFGIGLLLGLDTLVSQSFGAKRLDECHAWFVQSIYLVLLIGPAVMLVLLGCEPLLGRMGAHPAVLAGALPFLRATTWGTVPLFFYAALRRYLQGMGLVRPVMFAFLSANLINAVGDWLLIDGHLGLPAMGVAGSGWATTISRAYMAGVLAAYAAYHDLRHRTGLFGASFRPRAARLWRLLRLGVPAALHATLEVGVFAAATMLAGTLDPAALAAHHIVLDVSSVTFMIPLGLASAGAVRVGQALGRGEPAAAGRAGWTALVLGVGFMAASGTVMALVPGVLASLFTTDPDVIGRASTLMLVAAAFQLFDGLQGVSTGTMRGAGDTHTPMVVNLVAHWVIGLPLGYLLGFIFGYGVVGLWVGLALGLGSSGLYLLRAWFRRAGALARGEHGAHAAAEPAA